MKKYIWRIVALSIALAALYYIASNPHPFTPKTVEPVIRAQDTIQVERMPVKGDRRIKFMDLSDQSPSITDCFQWGENHGEYYAAFGSRIIACKDSSDAIWTIIDSTALKKGIASILFLREKLREKEVDSL